jgi:C1A family cysteine protease
MPMRLTLKAKSWYGTVLLAALVWAAIGCSLWASEGRVAPLNPAFEAYLQRRFAKGPELQVTVEGYVLGHVPSPVDRSHLRTPVAFLPKDVVGQPATYNLRTLGRVTPVRDQGYCGSCWAFATMASLESALLSAGKGVWDLSENNLKECHGFILGPCSGGNTDFSMAYFARRDGPVAEADDSYYDYPTGCIGGLPARRYLREAWIFPQSDVSGIKDAIMTYGALYTGLFFASAYYDEDHYTYYCPSIPGSNHAVALVGWDDTFDRNLFPGDPKPPGDGAWICKNSWGIGWGDSGYFYLSYYDVNAASYATLFMNAPASDCSAIYQHDPLGWVYNWGGYGDRTCWGANVFMATEAGYLTRVAFYTTDVNTSYHVYVKRGGPDGTVVHDQAGSFTYSGYHTVDLTSLVTLSSDETFTVAIEFVNPTYDYPLAVEGVGFYTPGATASPGQSYESHDGSPGSWTDISDPANEDPPYNACIKAIVWPGDTPAAFRVDTLGNTFADGDLYGQGIATAQADVAEWVSVSEPVQAGDVLELDPLNPGFYRRARTACSTLVAGVVSSDPGVILGADLPADDSRLATQDFRLSTPDSGLSTPDSRLGTPGSELSTPDSSLGTLDSRLSTRDSHSALLAVIGIVPVKVTDVGGPIAVGDLLVASSEPGCARRWTEEDGPNCGFIGKALESFDDGTGVIQVLLMR